MLLGGNREEESIRMSLGGRNREYPRCESKNEGRQRNELVPQRRCRLKILPLPLMAHMGKKK